MKALLMHPDRDFDSKPAMSPHANELTRDLELTTLWVAMAGNDQFVFEIARSAILSGVHNDRGTILYRQDVLRDCLGNPEIVRDLYALSVEAILAEKRPYFGFLGRFPSSILYGSVELLQMQMDMLRKLRAIADVHGGRFESKAFAALFALLRTELSDDYFDTVADHLKQLKFGSGVLLSAALGRGNTGTAFALRKPHSKPPNWFDRILGNGPQAYTVIVDKRDDAGARTLSSIRDRGINLVANATAQSAEHIRSFFEMLRAELAFYVGCLNLRDRLSSLGQAFGFPQPEPSGTHRLRFTSLYDVCLALRMGRRVVGNSLDADGKGLVIITGANQGGKSSFLRGVGVAQLMMQCGMFVGADSYVGELCAELFTHYKREEDATMSKGKLDEELARLSDIVDAIGPNSMVMFNESFAATNESEGSEIARQVVSALTEKGIKVFFVTHLFPFAHGLSQQNVEDACFLRAERLANGVRTFKLVAGEPLETSYGHDVYNEVFVGSARDTRMDGTQAP
jgi:hypothetical protein